MTKDTLYRIPDLEWHKVEGVDRWMAETPERHYSVETSCDGWILEYMICENIVTVPCIDIEDGKSKANAHYRARMARGLVEVKQDTKGTP